MVEWHITYTMVPVKAISHFLILHASQIPHHVNACRKKNWTTTTTCLPLSGWQSMAIIGLFTQHPSEMPLDHWTTGIMSQRMEISQNGAQHPSATHEITSSWHTFHTFSAQNSMQVHNCHPNALAAQPASATLAQRFVILATQRQDAGCLSMSIIHNLWWQHNTTPHEPINPGTKEYEHLLRIRGFHQNGWNSWMDG